MPDGSSEDKRSRAYMNLGGLGADLSCPLEQDILDKAYKALMSKKAVASKYKGIFDVT